MLRKHYFILILSCIVIIALSVGITAKLYKAIATLGGYVHDGNHLLSWMLRPQSSAKPFPDYIPESIRQDYTEACLIQDISPNASATLSRRCLQGMIRNFWGISKKSLNEEIKELETKVDPSTWQAIDALRQIGNIGAHMEKDVNVIIDVEPEEASLLIGLIETLLKDWYITRHEREERNKNLQRIAQAKNSLKLSHNKP